MPLKPSPQTPPTAVAMATHTLARVGVRAIRFLPLAVDAAGVVVDVVVDAATALGGLESKSINAVSAMEPQRPAT